MIKTIQRRLDAILHWNISFVGGFLGGYAILSHAGVFGSAQTGNLMEMASVLWNGRNWDSVCWRW